MSEYVDSTTTDASVAGSDQRTAPAAKIEVSGKMVWQAIGPGVTAPAGIVNRQADGTT